MREYLKKSFSDIKVNIVKCPDLTALPYCLTAPGKKIPIQIPLNVINFAYIKNAIPFKGLCGRAEVIEVGNRKYWYNPPRDKELSWNILDLIDRFYMGRTSLVIGESFVGYLIRKYTLFYAYINIY